MQKKIKPILTHKIHWKWETRNGLQHVATSNLRSPIVCDIWMYLNLFWAPIFSSHLHLNTLEPLLKSSIECDWVHKNHFFIERSTASKAFERFFYIHIFYVQPWSAVNFMVFLEFDHFLCTVYHFRVRFFVFKVRHAKY